MRLKTFVFLILIACSVLYTYYRHNEVKNDNAEHLSLMLTLYSERIKSSIENSYEVVNFFDTMINLSNGKFTKEEFNKLASATFDDNTQIAIAYMPNGVVDAVYPSKNNNPSIQQNVKVSDENMQNNRNVILSGPYKIVQSDLGFVAQKPIYVGKKFWGYISVVLDPLKILNNEAQLSDLSLLEYEYLIRTPSNNEDVIISKTPSFSFTDAKSMKFNANGKEFEFYLYETYFEDTLTYFTLSVLTITISISTFIYFIIGFFNARLNRIRDEANRDALTKLPNRKALSFYGKGPVKQFKEGYTVFFIDLNKFKPVNDELGHEVGDKLLIAYAKRLKTNFRRGSTIVRLGGDEFVVVINEILNEKEIESVYKTIKKLSENQFSIKRHKINIGASIGIAQYPKDGKNIDEVLEKADKLMYEDKGSKAR